MMLDNLRTAPGMVETEFSLVRFGGDEEAAKKPCEGVTPLSGDDIADGIASAVTRPPHVNVDQIVIRHWPRASRAPARSTAKATERRLTF